MTEVAVDCVTDFLRKYDSLPVKTQDEMASVTNKVKPFKVGFSRFTYISLDIRFPRPRHVERSCQAKYSEN